MTIHLVSNKGRATLFAAVKKDGSHKLVKVAPGKLSNALREAPEDSFFYLDASAFSAEALWEALDTAGGDRPGCVGVFDPDGKVTDPARVFFHGGADYLPKRILSRGVSPARFEEARAFGRTLRPRGAAPPGSGPSFDAAEAPRAGAEAVGGDTDEAVVHLTQAIRPPEEILSGQDWDSVEAGKVYTFWLLYAHLDDTNRYTAHTSDAYTSQVAERFREHLLDEMERFGARIWMWKRFGGLLLFPYDGERCMPIIPVFRMFLNRVIANVEHYQLKNPVSYRIALHLGNTPYQEVGDTGGVVSQDVNFIFHLGSKFTESGGMTITDTALSFVPEKLQRYFSNRGTFEGRPVYEMHRIVFGA
ncbi:MAG: hypothetical protein ACOCYG_02025 [Spirochaetota bacterium]